jgi:hypothetical protein
MRATAWLGADSRQGVSRTRVPLPGSRQPWQQKKASNKAPAARTEPQNPGKSASDEEKTAS